MDTTRDLFSPAGESTGISERLRGFLWESPARKGTLRLGSGLSINKGMVPSPGAMESFPAKATSAGFRVTQRWEATSYVTLSCMVLFWRGGDNACLLEAVVEMKVNNTGEALAMWQAHINGTAPGFVLWNKPKLNNAETEPNKLGLRTSGVFTLELGCPCSGSQDQEKDDSAVVQGSWLRAEH